LYFDIKSIRKILRPAVGQSDRAFGIALYQRLTDVAYCRTRQSNQTFGGRSRQPLTTQLGAAAPHVFAKGAREELTQIEITPFRAAQQHDTGGVVTRLGIFNCHFTTDDGLHAAATRALEKLHRAKQICRVRNR